MKMAIVGSRNFPSMNEVTRWVEFVAKEEKKLEIVSGGARGVDYAAAKAALRLGLPLREFPADWKKHGKAAGPLRNQQIAEYADVMYAFWDGFSRGTQDAVRRMRHLGKRVVIIPPWTCASEVVDLGFPQ